MLGYAPDFVQVAVGPLVKELKQKGKAAQGLPYFKLLTFSSFLFFHFLTSNLNFLGIRVVSNAGGVNPAACATALREISSKAGVDLKIATVTGDDLMPQVSD